MARKARFYAWSAPALGVGIFPDHTWVTTYDSRTKVHKDIKAVVAAGEHFWYCWGDFRRKGGTLTNRTGALGDSTADLEEARCLVQPDAVCPLEPAACGTIFEYGENGVCHQLANQVLYATGTQMEAPLTVVRALGYQASIYIYGSYGVPEATWNVKRDACRSRRLRTPHQPEDGKTMVRDLDEFEIRARTLLKDQDPKLLSDLLALRNEAQKVPAKREGSKPTANELNARNQRMLDRAAALLGPANFERIFQFPPEQRVKLVDPRLLRRHPRNEDIQTNRRFLRPHAGVAGLGRRKEAHPTTVTLKHLAAALADEHELSKKQAEAVLDDLVARVTKHLKKGERIRIVGLGILQVRKRAARMGRNPATGEAIHIKASKKVAFRAAKDLKEAI